MYWRGFKVLEKNKSIVKDPALDWDLFYNIQYIYETSKEYNGFGKQFENVSNMIIVRNLQKSEFGLIESHKVSFQSHYFMASWT